MKFCSIVSICLTVIFSGCTAYTPKYLRISSVKTVEKEELSQIVANSIHNSLINGDFLIFQLASEIDLVEYSERKGYSLYHSMRFCNELDIPLFTFGLYSESESIRTQPIKINHIGFSVSESLFNYYIVAPMVFSRDLEIYGRPERKGAVFYKKYDLTKSPNDLCFNVGGASYGFGFKSNTAVFKREEIIRAINQ